MSAKQDKTSARTPEDLERKYKFEETFAKAFGLAEDAATAAKEASESVEKLDEKLTPEEVFNRLTNNGAAKGIYRTEDGQIYINASYLAAGIIRSENGKLVIDLSGASEPTFNTGISTNGLIIRADAAGAENLFKVDATETSNGYCANVRVFSTNGYSTLQRTTEIFSVGTGDPNGCVTEWYSVNGKILAELHATNNGAGMEFYLDDLCLGYFRGYVTGESALKTTIINDKTVSWKDNGDGTFTLIGQ